MERRRDILFFTLFTLVFVSCENENKTCFPPHFIWGVATASYQIEGAWNEAGKGESIWDHYTHTYPHRIFDHSNGDVADDSYHKMKDDIDLLKKLKVQFYRFSISWSRVLPTGFSNAVNEEGLKYYKDLIDELIDNGIQPLVTMYHWDLPQPLQDLGGWTNPVIADYFEDYARVLFNVLGDKVKAWITFNEPLSFCEGGYGGDEAPGRRASGLEDYMCGHNVLRAHGRVYRMFQREFKKRYPSSTVGITLDMAWMEPATTSPKNKAAAEIARQFMYGWWAHPIFSDKGDYPPAMRQRIDDRSKKQGYPRSRLPVFTEEEVDAIKGSADFLGLNHYTTYLVSKVSGKAGKTAHKPSFYNDMGVSIYQNPQWPKSNSTWLKVVPWGFRKVLNYIKNVYNNPNVVITENGVSLEPGLNDQRRVNYIEAYLRNLHSAITIDHCNVLGYTHWSLMDNFEWLRGYSERFGLFEVDYNSPSRTRKPRLSASYYTEVVSTGCL